MFFIRNQPIADAPWRVHDATKGTIIDSQGRLVAIVPPGPPHIKANTTIPVSDQFAYSVPRMESMTPAWHENNQHLIAAAPELLAALKEAAYHLDSAGIPLNDSFYELINRASGGMNPIKPKSKKQ